MSWSRVLALAVPILLTTRLASAATLTSVTVLAVIDRGDPCGSARVVIRERLATRVRVIDWQRTWKDVPDVCARLREREARGERVRVAEPPRSSAAAVLLDPAHLDLVPEPGDRLVLTMHGPPGAQFATAWTTYLLDEASVRAGLAAGRVIPAWPNERLLRPPARAPHMLDVFQDTNRLLLGGLVLLAWATLAVVRAAARLSAAARRARAHRDSPGSRA